MAALPFFSANAGEDLIRACLKLAMIYRCDPADMLGRPQEYIAALIKHTPDVLNDMIEAGLYGRGGE